MTGEETILILKKLHAYFYQSDYYREFGNVCEGLMCAISAVKRRIMTEPKINTNAYGTRFYYCPCCERPIIKSGIIGEPRHCVDCGQALKWDVIEKGVKLE